MKYLPILLHIYQPSTQLGFVVDDIALYNNLVFAVAERLYKGKKNESTA